MAAMTCPKCGERDLHSHSLTVWCMACGWARNRNPDPATGRAPRGVGQQLMEW